MFVLHYIFYFIIFSIPFYLLLYYNSYSNIFPIKFIFISLYFCAFLSFFIILLCFIFNNNSENSLKLKFDIFHKIDNLINSDLYCLLIVIFHVI